MTDQSMPGRPDPRIKDKNDRHALGHLLDFVSSEASRLGLEEVSRLALLASRHCRTLGASH